MLLIRKIDEKNDNVWEAGILGRNMWEEGIFRRNEREEGVFRKNEREEGIQHPCHHHPNTRSNLYFCILILNEPASSQEVLNSTWKLK